MDGKASSAKIKREVLDIQSKAPQLRNTAFKSICGLIYRVMPYVKITVEECGFLDAPSHLYLRLCPSVGPSVGPSVRMSRVIFEGEKNAY